MENLNIKVGRIYKLPDAGPIKAYVDITINDIIMIKHLRILQDSNNRLFIVMPHEQGKDKNWYDSVRCLTLEFYDHLQEIILKAYMTQCSV